MIHELKTLSEYFKAVSEETKTFEVRKNDRPFMIGDFLALNEFENGKPTGRCMMVRITYILDKPEFCKDGFCTLGIVGCAVRAKNDFFMGKDDFARCGIPVYGGEK